MKLPFHQKKKPKQETSEILEEVPEQEQTALEPVDALLKFYLDKEISAQNALSQEPVQEQIVHPAVIEKEFVKETDHSEVIKLKQQLQNVINANKETDKTSKEKIALLEKQMSEIKQYIDSKSEEQEIINIMLMMADIF